MKIGPIFFFRGSSDTHIALAAAMVTDERAPAPLLLCEGARVEPTRRLATYPDRTVWSCDIAAPASAETAVLRWRWHDRASELTMPGRAQPLRIAYASCNGREDEDMSPTDHRRRNLMWADLVRRHRAEAFHLLLQGGDQIYADDLWRTIPELKAWRGLSRRARRRTPLPPSLPETLRRFYADHYCVQWGQDEISAALGAIPSLMMWDDHDIFDGWGSRARDLQRSPVHQAIFAAAREAFAVFQLGVDPDALPEGFGERRGEHFGWSGRLGPVGFVAPDLRSQRTQTRVLDRSGWTFVEDALARLEGCRHLVVMSSVPLANVDLSWMERLLRLIPGEQLHQDDLRDQWMSYAHREEWARMVRTLLDFGERSGAPVTVVSGEIHLGALARITVGRSTLMQLIASGIVHPPPRALARGLNVLASRPYARGDIAVEMLPLPGEHARYLNARNWLELEISLDGALSARWHHEGPGASPLVWHDARRAFAPQTGRRSDAIRGERPPRAPSPALSSRSNVRRRGTFRGPLP